MIKTEIEDYYFKYLNYDGNKNIVCSKNRGNTVNFFHYPIIVAIFENKFY